MTGLVEIFIQTKEAYKDTDLLVRLLNLSSSISSSESCHKKDSFQLALHQEIHRLLHSCAPFLALEHLHLKYPLAFDVDLWPPSNNVIMPRCDQWKDKEAFLLREIELVHEHYVSASIKDAYQEIGKFYLESLFFENALQAFMQAKKYCRMPADIVSLCHYVCICAFELDKRDFFFQWANKAFQVFHVIRQPAATQRFELCCIYCMACLLHLKTLDATTMAEALYQKTHRNLETVVYQMLVPDDANTDFKDTLHAFLDHPYLFSAHAFVIFFSGLIMAFVRPGKLLSRRLQPYRFNAQPSRQRDVDKDESEEEVEDLPQLPCQYCLQLADTPVCCNTTILFSDVNSFLLEGNIDTILCYAKNNLDFLKYDLRCSAIFPNLMYALATNWLRLYLQVHPSISVEKVKLELSFWSYDFSLLLSSPFLRLHENDPQIIMLKEQTPQHSLDSRLQGTSNTQFFTMS